MEQVGTPKKTNEQRFNPEQISKILNSPETLERMRKLEQGLVGNTIGYTIEFLICFPKAIQTDVNNFLDFVLAQSQKPEDLYGKSSFPEQKTVTRYYVNFFKSKYPNKDIKLHFAEIGRQNYSFHAFNSSFLQSIKTHGLDPHERQYDWSELKEIKDIMEGIQSNQHIGLAFQDKGKISFSESPIVSFDYGNGSPEWFDMFVYHFTKNNKLYRHRNYAEAKEKVTEQTKWLQDPDRLVKIYGSQSANAPVITQEQADKIISFFDKYWKIFAVDSVPMLAIYPDEQTKSASEMLKIREEISAEIRRTSMFQDVERSKNEEDRLIEFVSNMLPHSGSINSKTDQKIEPDKIVYVNLPNANEIYIQ